MYLRLLFPFLFLVPLSANYAQQVELAQEFEFKINQNHQCISNEDRNKHLAIINDYFSDTLQRNSSVNFIWPVQASQNHSHPGFYTVSNFMDHNSNYQEIKDYQCGERSYDLANGYNHQGTDIFLWPYGWDLMAYDMAEVVASADGIIIQKFDGQIDNNCDFTNSEWNAVYLQHLDGSITWYGHLKKNSLTQKAIGDSVSQGEVIGIVGSSGYSTGPHLHFEVYDPSGILIDPFEGNCNNQSSSWINQPEYFDPAVLRLASHNQLPQIGNCQGETEANFWQFFNPGDSVYLAVYYRDLLISTPTTFAVYTPQGEEYYSWDYSIDIDYYNAAYLSWLIVLPGSAEIGLWSFEVDFEGTTHNYLFEVVDSPAGSETIDQKAPEWNLSNYLLQFEKEISHIKILDLSGALVFSGINKSKVDLNSLSSGVYIANVEYQNQIFSFKFVLHQ